MKPGKIRKEIVSVSLPADLNDILGDVCRSDGIPRSRIIVQALEAYIRFRYPHMWKILEVNRHG